MTYQTYCMSRGLQSWNGEYDERAHYPHGRKLIAPGLTITVSSNTGRGREEQTVRMDNERKIYVTTKMHYSDSAD